MSRNKLCLLLVVVILLFSISSPADFDTGIPCFENGLPSEEICQAFDEPSKQHYCNPETFICFQIEIPETTTTTTTTTEEVNDEETISQAEEKIAALEATLAALKTDLASAKVNMVSTTNNIAAIQNQLSTLKNDLRQDLAVVDSQMATGLAGLQKDIDTTQTTLSTIEETLNKQEAFRKLITTIAFILFAFIVAGLVIYFVTKKSKTKTHPDVINHITNHIKQGKKYSHIKENLLKQGWKEKDIEFAYNETAKHNYKKFKTASKEKKISKPSLLHDRTKVISIAVVSLLLVAGILFVLGGVTGKAIDFKKLIGGEVEGYAGEVTYTVECTPPHILTPDEDACCLDNMTVLINGTELPGIPNAVCDNIETRQVAEMVGNVCVDNAQCGQGEYCINGQCSTLLSLYQGIGDCNKLCHYYAITVKVVYPQGTEKKRKLNCEINFDCDDEKPETQDVCHESGNFCTHAPLVEEYRLKPKQGSYTAMGALEWKILEMPQHCKGEPAIVPIKIIRKQTGGIINEEVIALNQGGSHLLTHPEFQAPLATLKIDKIFQLCPE